MKHNKLKKIIGIIAGLLVVVAAIITAVKITGERADAKKETEKNTYLALKYMADGNSNMAENHLGNVKFLKGNTMKFNKDCADVLLQKLSGNDSAFSIQLKLIEKKYELDDDESDIVSYLENTDDEAMNYRKVSNLIIDNMHLSDKATEKYDSVYEIESSAIANGYVSKDDEIEFRKLCGRDAADKLVINAALVKNDYNSAVKRAVKMVNRDASDDNRIILADVLSHAAGAGYTIDKEMMGGGAKGDRSEQKRIERQIEKTQEDISELNESIYNESDSNTLSDLYSQLDEKNKEIEELQNDLNGIYLNRAINSVSTIKSLDAKVAESELYFAMNDKDKAMEVLKDASNSWMKKFSDNDRILLGLDYISDLESGVYNKTNITDSDSEKIESMFDSITPGIVHVDNYYGEGNFLSDIADEILADYRYQDTSIYFSSVDYTQYPQISFMVNARQDVLDEIVDKKMTLRDTHFDITSYEAELEEYEGYSIAFVLDHSGSMEGTPIDDAKSALGEYVRSLNSGTEASLVIFDDVAEISEGLTTNLDRIATSVSGVYADGGTNIDDGINKGVESLEGAAGQKAMILMTDGQSYISDDVLETAVQNGVTIFTIGFGEVDQVLLTHIAEYTGGTFTLAASTGDLSNVYSSIGTLIGNRVKVTYNISENVDETDRYIYGYIDDFKAFKKVSYNPLEKPSEKPENDETDIVTDENHVFYDINSYIEDNREFSIYINGSYEQFTNGNVTIDSVDINGVSYVPENNEYNYSSISIDITDPLSAGLYDATINYSDGKKEILKNSVIAYDSNKSTYYSNTDIKSGNTIINTSGMLALDDGTIYMDGMSIIEREDYYDNTGLDLYTGSLVTISGIAAVDPDYQAALNAVNQMISQPDVQWTESTYDSDRQYIYIEAYDTYYVYDSYYDEYYWTYGRESGYGYDTFKELYDYCIAERSYNSDYDYEWTGQFEFDLDGTLYIGSNDAQNMLGNGYDGVSSSGKIHGVMQGNDITVTVNGGEETGNEE